MEWYGHERLKPTCSLTSPLPSNVYAHDGKELASPKTSANVLLDMHPCSGAENLLLNSWTFLT